MTQLELSLIFFIQKYLENFLPAVRLLVDLHKSYSGLFILLFALLVYSVIFLKKKSQKIHFIFALILGIGSTDLVSTLIKKSTERPRPFLVSNAIEIQCSVAGSYSFPSNHAANTMMAALILWTYTQSSWGVLFLLIPLWIGFSRILCGVHYPSDVLAGFFLACIIYFLFKKLEFYFRRKNSFFLKLS